MRGGVRGVGLAAIVLLVSACGAATNITGVQSRRQAQNAQSTASLFQTSPASSAEIKVIRGWSDALRRGDVTTAAGYFALPSQMINGNGSGQGALIRIDSTHDALLANEALPCGAKLISAHHHGTFIDALFRLSSRPGPGGSTCSGGVGFTARTFFLIHSGHIVAWIRAPDEPGDNKGKAPPSGQQVNPTPDQPPAQTGPIA